MPSPFKITTARNAVNGALQKLSPRKKRLNELKGYDFEHLSGLPRLLSRLEAVKRLLGDSDAVKGTKSATMKSLYEVRGVLLRRAKADVDFGGKVITRALLDAVEPGTGPRDLLSDVVRLATAYLAPGAPKTPYSAAELKAARASAQAAVEELGVDAIDLDRKELAAQRDALVAQFARSWRLTVAASDFLDAVDDTDTRLPTPYEKPRRAKKPAAPPA